MEESVRTEPPRDHLTLTDRELLDRLGWFTHIRWIMGGASLLILLASWYVLGIRFCTSDGTDTMGPGARVVLVIFLYNAAFTFAVHAVRSRGHITRRLIVLLALGQIVCDMLAVCALVHYSGGIENFFLIMILLPLVIATELLPQSLAYATAGGAAALVHALAWSEQQGILRHVRVVWPGGSLKSAAPCSSPLYVLEVTTALTVMIFATVFIASSISRRLREREAELEDAYRRLHLADEAKSFFMRKAGHEMRAPLAAIYSILDAVAKGPADLKGEQERLLGRAQHRLHALMDLVEDLRRYSRLRSDDGTLQVKPLWFDRIVTVAMELFHTQAKSAGIHLDGHVEAVMIEGDEELLSQLVTNLVANAVQYTPSGGRIGVELTCRDRLAVLRVADTGIGISEEAREKLFSEFFRAAEAKTVFPEGTGLGLAICKRIVQMHRGEIEVSPRPEGGTVFTVRLPMKLPGGGTPL